MKEILTFMKRFTLGFLVVLLFSNSTFAYSLDYHFCQNELSSVSFFGVKASCTEMDGTNQRSCCDKIDIVNDEESVSQKSCCSNEQLKNSSVLEKKTDPVNVFLSAHFALLPMDFTVAFIADVDVQTEVTTIAHPPFLYRKNNQSTLQVFLI